MAETVVPFGPMTSSGIVTVLGDELVVVDELLDEFDELLDEPDELLDELEELLEELDELLEEPDELPDEELPDELDDELLAVTFRVTVALADFVGSATLVAVTVTFGELVMLAGAVYTPFTNVPTCGFRDHVTAEFDVPLTDAAKVAVCPAFKDAVFGETLMPTIAGCDGEVLEGFKTMATLAFFVESAALVAVSNTDCWTEMVLGAVYKPLETEPTFGVTAQTTAVFELP